MYVLTTIENLVDNILNAESGSRKSVVLGKFTEGIKAEVKGAKISFKSMLLEEKDECYLQRFYHVHEEALINILERLEKVAAGRKPGQIGSATEQLTKLLQYLKEGFSNYFDDSLVAPKCWMQLVDDDVVSKFDGLRARAGGDFIDKLLWDIALKPIEEFIHKKGDHCTFHEIHYVKLLQSALIQFTPTVQDINVARQDLVNLLIRMNFNNPDFFQFCCKHFTSKVSVAETLSDRVDQVFYFFKNVSQVEVVPRVAFDVAERPIKMQLLDWLSSELEYLRQKQILQYSCPSKDEMFKTDFKLSFDLSVAHLAYLFKAFIETGVIQNKNTSELIRFLTKFVKTKKAEMISYESFRIKFYDAESGTKDAVKKMLQSLLSYVGKN